MGNADPSAPWDNELFGKNSKFGGWHVNVPIPFGKSVRVTMQLPEWWNGTERIFAMVRGVEDLPVTVAGVCAGVWVWVKYAFVQTGFTRKLTHAPMRAHRQTPNVIL